MGKENLDSKSDSVLQELRHGRGKFYKLSVSLSSQFPHLSNGDKKANRSGKIKDVNSRIRNNTVLVNCKSIIFESKLNKCIKCFTNTQNNGNASPSAHTHLAVPSRVEVDTSHPIDCATCFGQDVSRRRAFCVSGSHGQVHHPSGSLSSPRTKTAWTQPQPTLPLTEYE